MYVLSCTEYVLMGIFKSGVASCHLAKSFMPRRFYAMINRACSDMVSEHMAGSVEMQVKLSIFYFSLSCRQAYKTILAASFLMSCSF